MLHTLQTLSVYMEISLWGGSILLLMGIFLSLYFLLSIQLEKHFSIFETRVVMPIHRNNPHRILRR